MTSTIDGFFKFARARHQIYLARQAGQPWPWTDDPILQMCSFTNIFRELDRTTIWFREHVRGPLANSPDVLLATVVFRWFNRIETGQHLIECGQQLAQDPLFIFTKYTPELHQQVYDFITSHAAPYITGAYIIRTSKGVDKVHGVLQNLDSFVAGYRNYAIPRPPATTDLATEIHRGRSLQLAWRLLRSYMYIGDFMAYEVVTDLRHTYLLSDATDTHTWASPGPGARRGLNRIDDLPINRRMRLNHCIERMKEMLEAANNSDELWPYDPLEMRDIEHTLCEFDKYERVRLNQGRSKRRYRHTAPVSLSP